MGNLLELLSTFMTLTWFSKVKWWDERDLSCFIYANRKCFYGSELLSIDETFMYLIVDKTCMNNENISLILPFFLLCDVNKPSELLSEMQGDMSL